MLPCHLRPLVPTVLFGFSYEAHNAPAYQISAQSGNARMSYSDLSIWLDEFYSGPYSALFSQTGVNRTAQNLESTQVHHRRVLDFRYVAAFRK